MSNEEMLTIGKKMLESLNLPQQSLPTVRWLYSIIAVYTREFTHTLGDMNFWEVFGLTRYAFRRGDIDADQFDRLCDICRVLAFPENATVLRDWSEVTDYQFN